MVTGNIWDGISICATRIKYKWKRSTFSSHGWLRYSICNLRTRAPKEYDGCCIWVSMAACSCIQCAEQSKPLHFPASFFPYTLLFPQPESTLCLVSVQSGMEPLFYLGCLCLPLSSCEPTWNSRCCYPNCILLFYPSPIIIIIESGSTRWLRLRSSSGICGMWENDGADKPICNSVIYGWAIETGTPNWTVDTGPSGSDT